jgi:hypothetical protein
MEIDAARSPEPHHLSPTTDPGSIPTLDGWIESLMTCKQLAEEDVRRLCDRVCSYGGMVKILFPNSCLSGARGLAGGVKRPTCGMCCVFDFR